LGISFSFTSGKKSMPRPNKKKGLKIIRHFTKTDQSPYENFTYTLRSSVIRNSKGDAIFELNNVEVPEGWSQIATDILAQKYFRKTGVKKEDGSEGSENSVKQVVHRMASCWKSWGEQYGYFDSTEDAQVFYDELVYSLLSQSAAPNSPQWFNTGLYHSYGIKGKSQGHFYVDPETKEIKTSSSAYERPQPHACFILSVKDDLVNEGGIMDLWMREARIFKYGSGSGTNYSDIRGEGEKLSGGGASSGLMSFLKIGDRAAGAIKSGGTTRRAAKMVCLDMDHPEIEEFIDWKVEEEKKVAALIEAGYSSDYEGEAYKTVSGQNSNNSIRIPNSFFKALKEGKDWELKARSDGHLMKRIPAKDLWNKIAYAAWACADPGVQFDDTINEWHTCPNGGKIRASNPCSEYMFLDNTACNLASINLRKFFDEAKQSFDVEGFEYTCRLWTIVLEISVLMAQFPSREVAQLSYDYRTLGLGFANLGSLLMVQGIPYDSPKARAIAASISSIMTGTAYTTSSEMAEVLGAFSKYEENKEAMLKVIRNHRFAAYNTTIDAYQGLEKIPAGIDPRYCPDYLLSNACKVWDEALQMGEKFGFRNAQVSAIAPTGTIGLLMDCDTTGIEPDFSIIKYKKLSGGGYFKIINQSIPAALKTLGYRPEEIEDIVNYARGTTTLVGARHINTDSLRARGFTTTEILQIEKTLPTGFSLESVFYLLREETYKRLGFTPEQSKNPEFNLLEALNFSRKQIEEANEVIFGTMTIEGAPYLKPEHYPVFDCANKCGNKGTRFIHPHGHIRMMATVQPFVSGAISKTVNMPNETSVEEIAECYQISWELGLKSCALYRDGSKLSQPLSGKKTKKTEDPKAPVLLTEEEVLEAARKIISQSKDTKFKRQLSTIVERKQLPAKRKGFTQKAKIDGQTLFVRTGEYGDGTLGEIFIDMYKEGAAFRSLLNCFSVAISIGLQYGVPLDEFVDKFAFTRFEPSGKVDHPNIKYATSIIDYIFRLLGYEYLNRTDLIHVRPEENTLELSQQQNLTDSKITPLAHSLDISRPKIENLGIEQTQKVLINMMGDAPACNVCGHITIRNGTCYKCLNCGNSLGCS
jgi:ribonucleoside-diphosphate reductase alpha chain